MPARLLSKSSECPVDLQIEDSATLGRDPDNTVQLPQRAVSKHHAVIRFDESAQAYVVEDLKSTNGTMVDGRDVVEPQPLGRLHVITLGGEVDLVFRDLRQPAERNPQPGQEAAVVAPAPAPLPDHAADAEGAGPADASDPAGTELDVEFVAVPDAIESAKDAPAADPDGEKTEFEDEAVAVPTNLRTPAAEVDDDGPAAPTDPPPSADSKYILEIEEPDGHRSRVALRPGENTVGRSPAADIRLADIDVSRRHAVIVVASSGVRLRDLGSSRGTFHEGSAVSSETEVKIGASIRMGNVMVKVVVASDGDG